jgi:secreted trypsin-like serine protease
MGRSRLDGARPPRAQRRLTYVRQPEHSLGCSGAPLDDGLIAFVGSYDRTVITRGCTNAAPVCSVQAVNVQASDQTVLHDRSCGGDVFWARPTYNGRTNICTRGTRLRSTINRGDSGGPLLVRDGQGGFRQVGVTALGSDSTTKLYAGFTSIPVERKWIDGAIRSLRSQR